MSWPVSSLNFTFPFFGLRAGICCGGSFLKVSAAKLTRSSGGSSIADFEWCLLSFVALLLFVDEEDIAEVEETTDPFRASLWESYDAKRLEEAYLVVFGDVVTLWVVDVLVLDVGEVRPGTDDGFLSLRKVFFKNPADDWLVSSELADDCVGAFGCCLVWARDIVPAAISGETVGTHGTPNEAGVKGATSKLETNCETRCKSTYHYEQNHIEHGAPFSGEVELLKVHFSFGTKLGYRALLGHCCVAGTLRTMNVSGAVPFYRANKPEWTGSFVKPRPTHLRRYLVHDNL